MSKKTVIIAAITALFIAGAVSAQGNLTQPITITAGTGLTKSGNTVNVGQGDGVTVNADDIAIDPTYTQRRVSGTCSAGSSIRAIAQDGTVTCETDDTGATIAGPANVLLKADGSGNAVASSWTDASGVSTTTGAVSIGTTLAVTGSTIVATGASNDFQVGSDTITSTDNTDGFRIAPNVSGNVFVDAKTFTGGLLTFRIGEGTERGFERTWLTVDPTDAKATFAGPVAVGGAFGATGLSTLTGGFMLGANSSAGSHKITNLANGTASSDAATVGQVTSAVSTSVSIANNTVAKGTGTGLTESTITDDGTTVATTANVKIGDNDTSKSLTIGDTPSSTTAADTGLRFNTDRSFGKAFFDTKLGGTTGQLTFRIGENTSAGSTTEWAKVTGAGAVTFPVGVTTPSITGSSAIAFITGGNERARFEADGTWSTKAGGTLGDSTSDTTTVSGSLAVGNTLDVNNDLAKFGSADGQVYINGNQINAGYASDVDSTPDLALNYRGFAAGTTRPRNLAVYDGQGGLIFKSFGATKLTQFSGAVSIDGVTTIGDSNLDQHVIHGNVTADYQPAGTTASFTSYYFRAGGTADTTAAGVNSIGLRALANTTRSAGTGTLTNIGLLATAANGQTNIAFRTDTGDVQLNLTDGTLTAYRDVTLNSTSGTTTIKGSTAIGGSTLTTRLAVRGTGGSAGITPSASVVAAIENTASNAYLGIYSNTNATGIEFGNGTSATDGRLLYDTSRNMVFRAGSADRCTISGTTGKLDCSAGFTVGGTPVATQVAQTITSGGGDDIALNADTTVLYWSNGANDTITGFTNGAAGRSFVLNITDSFVYTFVSNSTLSTAGNRLYTNADGDYVVRGPTSLICAYDSVNTRWGCGGGVPRTVPNLTVGGTLVVGGQLSKFGTTDGVAYFTGATVGSLNFAYNTNATADGYINRLSYQQNATQFRNLHIQDGKSNDVLVLTGSTKAAEFFGPADFDSTVNVDGGLIATDADFSGVLSALSDFSVTGDTVLSDTQIGLSSSNTLTVKATTTFQGPVNGLSGTGIGNGGWEGKHMEWWDEFMRKPDTSEQDGIAMQGFWQYGKNQGTCTASWATSAGHPGVAQLTPGSTGGNCSYDWGTSTDNKNVTFHSGETWTAELGIEISELADGTSGNDGTFIFGFADTSTAGTMNQFNGCFFAYDDRNHLNGAVGSLNAAKWECWCVESGISRTRYPMDGSTVSDSSFTTVNAPVTALNWDHLKLVVTDGTLAEFYVDGVKSCQITTHIPTGSLGPMMRTSNSSSGGADIIYFVDFVRYMVDLTTARGN